MMPFLTYSLASGKSESFLPHRQSAGTRCSNFPKGICTINDTNIAHASTVELNRQYTVLFNDHVVTRALSAKDRELATVAVLAAMGTNGAACNSQSTCTPL
jgi:hypothetical protein